MMRFNFTRKMVLLSILPTIILAALFLANQSMGFKALSEKTEAITGQAFSTVYQSNLESKSNDIVEKLSLKLGAIRKELNIVRGAAQTLIDTGLQHTLGKTMQETDYLKDNFVLSPNTHAANTARSDLDISTTAWGYLLNKQGEINKLATTYITSITPMKLILNAVGKNGVDKGWLYLAGPKDTPALMVYPWSPILDLMDEQYPGYNKVNWWDFFFPGMIEGWQKWADHPGLKDALKGDEVTLTPLYEDAGGTGLMVSFFSPLWSPDRKTNQGAVGLDYNVDKLIHLVQHESIGETGFAFLVQGNGNVLGIEESNAKLLQLDTEIDNSHGVSKATYKIGDSKIGKLLQSSVELKNTEEVSVHTITSEDGNSYLATLQRVSTYNLWTGNGP